ncbi:MAG: hypothetical protein V7K77_28520 [Nostoc sp.]|uniref:hypothetical protein n=1 Tax=Nostoc sp. TaxID=1180 RepID=UPI002FF680A7
MSVATFTSESGVTVGGWSPLSRNISKEASEVFEAAVKGLIGVSYSPIAFATQVVSGTNYRFVSHAKAVSPEAHDEIVIVDIYKPLHGPAYVTGIKPFSIAA